MRDGDDGDKCRFFFDNDVVVVKLLMEVTIPPIP
jgi:hypothetical protein